MSAEFPGAVASFRTIANRPGVAYDPNDTKTLFAEDVEKINDEIVAVETEFGTNPKGGFADVKERLENLKVWNTIPVLAQSEDVEKKFFTLQNLASGDTDIYTCPEGKKALVTGRWAKNNGDNTIIYQLGLKIGATFYRQRIPVSIATNVISIANSSVFQGCLNEGEKLVIRTDNEGLALFITVIEFPDTWPVERKQLLSLNSGYNTLYTCPAGKRAFSLGSNPTNYNASGDGEVQNDSGISQTYTWHHVLNGNSPDDDSRTTLATATPTASSLINQAYLVLEAGDSIVIEASANTAGQYAFIGIVEKDV